MSRGICGLTFSIWLLLPATFAQDLDSTILPRRTVFFIALQRSLNSMTASTGDTFSAIIEVPVTQNDQIIIPQGSFIIGHVAESAKAGRLKGKGQLLLAFDTIILPNGTTRNLRAVVQSAEGYKIDPAKETGQLEASGDQAEEVGGGAVTGTVVGATVGAIGGGTLRGAGIGAGVGAAAGAIIGLIQRGEEVELPRGSSLTIELREDVEFVKPEPVRRGTPLKP